LNERLLRIDLRDLDPADDRFSCSFPEESEALAESIRRWGLLNPIVVCETGGSPPYRVVSGIRRVRSLRRIGVDGVLSILIPPPGNGEIELFRRNLIENSVTRGLSNVERAAAVARLSERYLVPEGEIVESYLPLLGLNPSWTHFRHLMRIAELSPDVKIFLTKKSVPLGTAVEFGLFSHGEQRRLVSVFETFRYSSGKIKEVLENLDDVSKRERKTAEKILSESSFRDLLEDREGPLPQRADRFRDELKKRRNPRRTETERRIGESFRKLGLPKEVRLSVPSLSEGGKIRVEFEAKDPAHSKAILDRLSRLPDHPVWMEIFNFI
jgi:ParB-like chromosome segregation protein Spo0J